jgi:rare lipoprotein A (peptidoglycan hydrolase)
MNRKQLAIIVIAAGTTLGLAVVQLAAHARGREQRGWASWYGPGFAGRPTASGERFSPQALTAAHRSLPLGTQVRVTNLETRQAVDVRINDRGPFADPERRVIDLSQTAAARIGLERRGIGRVRVAILNDARPRPAAVTRARRRPAGEPQRQALVQPSPRATLQWAASSRLTASGAGTPVLGAAFAPLDCRVTPAICLAGD